MEITMADDIPENIDRFNRITLAVFAALYENFPNPIDLDSKVIGMEAGKDEIQGKEDTPIAVAWMEAALSTINWLKNEGFLTVKMVTFGGDFLQVVLTRTGLNALNQVPSSIKENPDKATLGTLAKSAAKSGAKEVIFDLVKLGVGAVLGS